MMRFLMRIRSKRIIIRRGRIGPRRQRGKRRFRRTSRSKRMKGRGSRSRNGTRRGNRSRTICEVTTVPLRIGSAEF
jgi:hypothetical protein